MPIYEYRCTACEHELEALQKMSDEPLRTCPACGADDLVKKVSAAAFRLKGAGWYETDFKKDGQRNLAGDKDTSKAGGKDSKASSDNGKTTDTKTSAKPAAKSSTAA